MSFLDVTSIQGGLPKGKYGLVFKIQEQTGHQKLCFNYPLYFFSSFCLRTYLIRYTICMRKKNVDLIVLSVLTHYLCNIFSFGRIADEI